MNFEKERWRLILTYFFALKWATMHTSYHIYGFQYHLAFRFFAYRIFRNKRPGCLIFRSSKKTFPNPSRPIGFVYSPLLKITHQNPSVLCTPPFEKSPIKTHRFCVLLLLKNHFFGERLFRGGRLFRQIRSLNIFHRDYNGGRGGNVVLKVKWLCLAGNEQLPSLRSFCMPPAVQSENFFTTHHMDGKSFLHKTSFCWKFFSAKIHGKHDAANDIWRVQIDLLPGYGYKWVQLDLNFLANILFAICKLFGLPRALTPCTHYIFNKRLSFFRSHQPYNCFHVRNYSGKKYLLLQKKFFTQYCIVPRCSVTFWTHPEIISMGQFFRRSVKSINQAWTFILRLSIDWLIDWR